MSTSPFSIGPAPKSPSTRLDEVFALRPFLKEVLEKNGSQSLQQFAEANLKKVGPANEERKDELLSCIEKIVTTRLGSDVAKGLIHQLKQVYCASSADHHGILNAGLAVSSNALLASGLQSFLQTPSPYTFVLSCASVSLNNDDYPRGFQFHAEKDGAWTTQKLSLLPSNAHSSLVYGFRAFKEEEVEKIEGVLRAAVRSNDVSKEIAEKVESVIKTVCRDPRVLGAPDLCSQSTIANRLLWNQLFANEAGTLVYVELEELVKEALCSHHLNGSTSLTKLFFDDASALQRLLDAMTPFVRQGVMGTHLFWGISEKHQRVTLQKEGEWLVSADGSMKVAFTPTAIAEGLMNRTLMPNLFVSYVTLYLYYGIECLGGFNQIHFLHALRKTYQDIALDPPGLPPSSPMYQYGWDLFFLNREPIHALDVVLYGGEDTWKRVQDSFKTVTLQEAFDASASIAESIVLGVTK